MVELHPSVTQPEGSPVSHWHTVLPHTATVHASGEIHNEQWSAIQLATPSRSVPVPVGPGCHCPPRPDYTSKQPELHWHTGDNLKPEVLPVHRDGEQDSGRGSSALQA